MKSVHLVIPDLFLPKEIAADVCADLQLSALEKLLARAQPAPLSAPLSVESLEAWLCEAFGADGQAIAPVTLRADGMEPGNSYWLRADPVHLRLQRDQLILQPDVPLNPDEAAQLCTGLNAHFAGDGLRFFAPHPQRWYLQLDAAPDMLTHSLARVTGRNVHAYLPHGPDALRWHGVFNEIQMLFHEHAVNQAREARSELPVNSVWLWGGGRAGKPLLRPFAGVYGDSPLAGAFAQVAGIPSAALPDDIRDCAGKEEGEVLLVWEGLRHAIQHGDLHAWRTSLQHFEQCCAAPLMEELRAGRIARLTLDVPGSGAARRFVLTRGAAWKLWRRARQFTRYALV